MFSYCFDKCPHNFVPRRSIQNGKELIIEAVSGKNKKLICNLGYKQTVNSRKAFVNSEKNGTRVCFMLRPLFENER